jgi:hypothetical protein
VPALNETFLLHGTVSVTRIAVVIQFLVSMVLAGGDLLHMGPSTRVLICVEFFFKLL